jgi:hypothetical protein
VKLDEVTYGYFRTLTSTQAVTCYLKHWWRSHGNGSFIIQQMH